MKKIRVLIVEDSFTVTELLKAIINNDSRLKVVATANSGEKALQIIPEVKPDIISMDIRLPGINGFVTTQQIMQQFPTPVVVVSASVESEELKISMNALRAGALAVLEKPLGLYQHNFEKVAHNLCTQLVIMSEVKVVRQRYALNLDLPSKTENNNLPLKIEVNTIPDRDRKITIMGIAASTGGPNALLEILCKLPKDFPLPILLVQHISKNFHEGFIQWLDSLCPFPVIITDKKVLPEPGKIYASLPDHHLVIDKGYIISQVGPEVSRHRPSATVMFRSLAKYYHRRVLGILLTGMGEDGAEGLKNIKNAGGYTIAEDKSTAVVYGMPASAVQIGGVCESVPLPKIAERICELISLKSKTNGMTLTKEVQDVR